MRINQNISALNSYRNLSSTNTVMGKSLEKLSSGYRINRAADDAAGLVISQGLRAQVSGLRQATRNAQDGISVVQTAEGALTEVHTMLNRMRDLAVQSANASNDADARGAAQEEISNLLQEIDRIGLTTKFGSQALLDGSFGVTPGTLSSTTDVTSVTWAAGDDFTVSVTGGSGAVTVELDAATALPADEAAEYLTERVRAALRATGNAVDAAAADKFSISVEDDRFVVSNSYSAAVTLADGTNTPLASDLAITPGAVAAASGSGGEFQVGAGNTANDRISVAIDEVSQTALGADGVDVSTIDVSTASGAQSAIDLLDDAIASVSTTRGNLGAVQNRFESTIANLQVTTENLAASESRIRDTDMALEMVSFTRHQILMQAGTAMLGQANQLPQGVLRLLG